MTESDLVKMEKIEELSQDISALFAQTIEIKKEMMEEKSGATLKEANIEIEETLFRCITCDQTWNSEGYIMKMIKGLFYEVEYFVCDLCKGGYER